MQISDELTRKLLTWLARQNAAKRCEVFKRTMAIRRETLNRLRAQPGADNRNSPEVEEQALLAAIQEARRQRLRSSDALEEIAASRAAAAKSCGKKKSPKRDRLQVLMPEILKLRKTGMSFAEIARVVSQKTRKKVSRSYVHSVCTESK